MDSGLEGCSGLGGGFARGNVPLIQSVYILLFVGRELAKLAPDERRRVHGKKAMAFSGRAIW